MLQVAACSVRHGGGPVSLESAAGATASPNGTLPTEVQSPDVRDFEGGWSYRNDCGTGHYVTLELRKENTVLAGSWSDGTLLRGSQGMIKGQLDQGRFVGEWCDEGGAVGSPSLCPSYEKLDDYLVFRDGTLVWYQKYGREYVEYVVLTKGSESHKPTKACDQDIKELDDEPGAT